jgi:hypothetical protein
MLANVGKSNSESRTNLNEHQLSKRVIRLGQRNFKDAAACPEALARRQPKKLLLLGSNVPAGLNPCENPADFRV